MLFDAYFVASCHRIHIFVRNAALISVDRGVVLLNCMSDCINAGCIGILWLLSSYNVRLG